MASAYLLIILVAIVIFCVSGLLYLAYDYFNRRKSSKVKTEKAKQQKEYQTEQFNLKRGLTLAQNLERSRRYEEAATEYSKIGMLDKAKHCMRMAKVEEAKNLEKAGKYEEAAEKYGELKMDDKAEDCRRMAKTNYLVAAKVNIGKAGTINVDCPYCSAFQTIATKSNEIKCKFCGKTFLVPKKALDLLSKTKKDK